MKHPLSFIKLTFLCTALAYSCNKQSNKESDFLEDAQFTKNKVGETITFREEEDFSFSNRLANKIGFSELSIQKGIYTIYTDAKNFGTVELKIKDYKLKQSNSTYNKDEILTAKIEDDGIGIRIAKRKKRTCGGEYVTCECCCGIGFRCGTTDFVDEEENDEVKSTKKESQNFINANKSRIKKVKFTFNAKRNTLNIEFIEKVDWRALN